MYYLRPQTEKLSLKKKFLIIWRPLKATTNLHSKIVVSCFKNFIKINQKRNYIAFQSSTQIF